MKYPTSPIQVAIELTSECNLNCIHCFTKSSYTRPIPKSNELTFDEIQGILKQLQDMKVFRIVLTGGEPLCRKDFYDILKSCIDHGFGPAITTNGVLLDREKLSFLNDVDINVGWQLSVHGATAQTHDRFVRRKGAFNKVINALHLLIKYDMQPSISITATKYNFQEIADLIIMVDSIGVKEAHVLSLVPSGRGTDIWDSFLGPKDWLSLFNQLQELDTSLRLIFDLRPYLLVAPSDYVAKIKQNMTPNDLAFASCPCGKTWCTILSDGNVIACSYLRDSKFYAGNVRKTPFDEIWNNSYLFKAWRNGTLYQIDEICLNCRFFDICKGGCPSAAYNVYGVMKSPDPRCMLVRRLK